MAEAPQWRRLMEDWATIVGTVGIVWAIAAVYIAALYFTRD